MNAPRPSFRSAWRPLCVLATWAWMSYELVRYVLANAARIPLRDDMELVPYLRSGVPLAWEQLWELHNEHRVPLPKLIAIGLFDVFDDVRAPMVLNAVLLCALAAGMMHVARRIRGCTSLTDVVFPLLWLSTGNAENLLMAFQLALILPTFAACTMLLVAIRRPRSEFTVLEALVLVACLVVMPLCGGPGLTQVPVLLSGLALAFAWSPRRTGARRVLGLGLLLGVAIVALYFVGYRRPSTEMPAHDVVRALTTAWRVIASAFGIAGDRWWPVSGMACAGMAFVTGTLLVRAWRDRAEERPRAVALAISMGAIAMLALAIGISRGGGGVEAGSAPRYITLPAPWIAATVFACILFGERLTRLAVPGALALALLAAEFAHNRPFAASYAGWQTGIARAFESEILGPLPEQVVLTRWTDRVYPNRMRLYQILGWMAQERIAPFDTASEEVRRKYSTSILDLPPEAVQSPVPPMRRFFDELCDVLAVPTDARLFLAAPPTATKLAGFFGVPPLWVQRGTTKGVRVIVRAEVDGTVLFDRTIDPVHVERDRGPQRFEAHFQAGSTGRVVLETTWPDGAPHVADWGYWADVYFE